MRWIQTDWVGTVGWGETRKWFGVWVEWNEAKLGEGEQNEVGSTEVVYRRWGEVGKIEWDRMGRGRIKWGGKGWDGGSDVQRHQYRKQFGASLCKYLDWRSAHNIQPPTTTSFRNFYRPRKWRYCCIQYFYLFPFFFYYKQVNPLSSWSTAHLWILLCVCVLP